MLLLRFLEPGCEDTTYSHEIHGKKCPTACIGYQYNGNSKEEKARKGYGNYRNLAEGVEPVLECWAEFRSTLPTGVTNSHMWVLSTRNVANLNQGQS